MVRDNDFTKHILDSVLPKARFEAKAEYDRDGDCIEFVATPEPFRAERVDDWLTVYYGQESGELVGSQVKRVSKLFERYQGLGGIDIIDGKIRLSLLFRAPGYSSDPERALVYRKLIDVADDADAFVEFECV